MLQLETLFPVNLTSVTTPINAINIFLRDYTVIRVMAPKNISIEIFEPRFMSARSSICLSSM